MPRTLPVASSVLQLAQPLAGADIPQLDRFGGVCHRATVQTERRHAAEREFGGGEQLTELLVGAHVPQPDRPDAA